MILVVGATGVLGQETSRLLLAQGHAVRAMTRTPDNAKSLIQKGAEVVAADLIDRQSLVRACRGVDRVFAAAHSFMGRGRYRSHAVDDGGHRALIDVARSAEIRRFVYTSALGAAPDHPVDFMRTKYAIEQCLRDSGIEHIILRPSAFMEWHAHTFNGKSILEKGRTQLLGSGTKLRNFVAASDVAKFAVKALTEPAVRQRVIEIGGPGNFSNNEVAELYARAAGIAARVTHLPATLVSVVAKIAQPIHPGISRVMRLSSLPDDAYPESFDSTALTREHSIELTTLQEFVQQQISKQPPPSHRRH
ncbi:MAG TPA: SDR family oxidoreductase [Burkholderiaceae bacterium]|nr:SDR family oxidoreductase [Burkholderiaceae bacterium]